MPDTGGESAAGAQVIRLHPVRTLVISRDLAFRQRAMTVLEDLGVVSFAIAGLEARGEVVALIEHQHPDVVVLDATACAPSIAGLVYELYERAPRVGVVIVSSSGPDHRLGLPALAKWGWAADLSRAVQQAYRDGNPLKEEKTLRAY